MAAGFGQLAASILSTTPGHRKEGDATDPVRRGSFHEDSRQAKPWRRHGDGDRRKWNAFKGAALGAFDKLYKAHCLQLRQERADRRAGKREDVTDSRKRLHGDDRAVLAYMLDRFNHMTGELFPRIDTIVDAVGKSEGYVKAALARLRTFGFLCWVRRTKTKEGSEGQAGPQLEQTSNAYYFAWGEQLVQEAKGAFQNLLTIGLKKLRAVTVAIKPAWPSDPALSAALAGVRDGLDRRDAFIPSAKT
ncbi:hypothetical protein [uncultured Sphingomonas sp.]|uniref:hypothetical protein n=1 Tax=uncultured Sphingomonas sp. TaxID=158754 RepID=UPI0025DD3929|nr:hypothetical protein [uncultured Sphingomonas sp.]